MADFKLTKTELKSQKMKLNQLQKYLPTLQLKKSLLQTEVIYARQEKLRVGDEKKKELEKLQKASSLLSINIPYSIEELISIQSVEIIYENIAGAEVPKLQRILFTPTTYDLYLAPPSIGALINLVQSSITCSISLKYADIRATLLEKELREVSIRVNLFEKVLIPRFKENIKKIKVFLGDLELAQIAQAKVAKEKIKRDIKNRNNSENRIQTDIGQRERVVFE